MWEESCLLEIPNCISSLPVYINLLVWRSDNTHEEHTKVFPKTESTPTCRTGTEVHIITPEVFFTCHWEVRPKLTPCNRQRPVSEWQRIVPGALEEMFSLQEQTVSASACPIPRCAQCNLLSIPFNVQLQPLTARSHLLGGHLISPGNSPSKFWQIGVKMHLHNMSKTPFSILPSVSSSLLAWTRLEVTFQPKWDFVYSVFMRHHSAEIAGIHWQGKQRQAPKAALWHACLCFWGKTRELNPDWTMGILCYFDFSYGSRKCIQLTLRFHSNAWRLGQTVFSRSQSFSTFILNSIFDTQPFWPSFIVVFEDNFRSQMHTPPLSLFSSFHSTFCITRLFWHLLRLFVEFKLQASRWSDFLGNFFLIRFRNPACVGNQDAKGAAGKICMDIQMKI